ncbi:hypothetical protein JOD55_001015 [Arcanobacterium pluranimalium]|uniref:DUF3039 domain-containing protein n=1 Tax=Arcanobacterium pluranimalium TaxID=108028 RepID=UPI00195BA9BA|nr:DUF3039 domain-containing protein [Arcanobacterium pluranimalium]MBM7825188.1 hypothetical protein [Arcanobacterium pluranimalium]
MSIDDPYSAPQSPGAPQGPDAAQSAGTQLLERTEEQQSPGDNERYAHYVRKDRITQSAVEGGPVVALCGKVWTPMRNPDRFPVCPTCKEIYKNLNGGGSNSWPFGPDAPGGSQ